MSAGSLLLGGTMGLLLTTRLLAQTLPVPTLPPETLPEPDPRPSPGAALLAPPPLPEPAEPARPRPWEYAVGTGLGWDGNIDFRVPHGTSGFAVVPRGGLARIFSGPRARLRATAAGSWTGYPGQSEQRRYYADLGAEGSYVRSPSTEWRASASYGFGYSDSSRILLEQGVSLPVVKTRSFAGALGLSTKQAGRGSLRIDGRVYRTDFDSPGLIDGSSVRGSVALERPLGSRGTTAIEYSVEYVRPDQAGTSHLTQFGSLQWTRLLSQRSALLLEAGASYTPDAARAGLDHKGSFFGGASFTRQVRRSSLTLFLRREVTPAFGTSVSSLELRTGLRASVTLGRRLELRVLASQVRPENPPAAQGARGSSYDAFAALGRRLGRSLEVSGEARYRRRGATGSLPAIDAFQAGLFLTLLTPSGRAIAPAPGL